MFKDGISVFTAVYNRAYCIGNLYNSLLRQTYKNFEWIIVNDGSTDNLKDVVEAWIKEQKVDIQFIVVNNGGKMRARNIAVKKATKRAFFTVDSDDYITDDCLEKLSNWFEEIKDKENYAGISGLRNNSSINRKFSFDYIDSTNCERRNFGLDVDMAECYKTDILRKYLAPEIPNENYISPEIVSQAIGYDGYLMRWYNQIIYIFEFQEDGLTKSGDDKLRKNPIGWGLMQQLNIKCRRNQYYTEFAYYRYYLMLQNILPVEKIAYYLGISEEVLCEVIKKRPLIINKINEWCKERNISSIALYGMGLEAQRFLLFKDVFEFEIVCGIDKQIKNCSIPCHGVEGIGHLDVDAVFVTNKYWIDEILTELSGITGINLYSIQRDLIPNGWNYYFCDV